jgi:hypothetical protein
MRAGSSGETPRSNDLIGRLDRGEHEIAAFVARHPPAERVLVFLDQLEELFTLANAAERQRFIATLRMLRSVPQCCLLLALRADFFGALLDSELGPDLARRISPLVVAPLRGAALAQAGVGRHDGQAGDRAARTSGYRHCRSVQPRRHAGGHGEH